MPCIYNPELHTNTALLFDQNPLPFDKDIKRLERYAGGVMGGGFALDRCQESLQEREHLVSLLQALRETLRSPL